MSDTDRESIVPGAKEKKLKFRLHHVILMLRQILASNPFQANNQKQSMIILERISTDLKAVVVTAQTRSIRLRGLAIIGDHEKGLTKNPPSGTEEEYGELQTLLGELADLRKEEREKAEVETNANLLRIISKKAPRPIKLSQQELLAGLEIREASMNTFKESTDWRSDTKDQAECSRDLGEEAINTDKTQKSSELANKKRFKRYKILSSGDKICQLLKTSSEAEILRLQRDQVLEERRMDQFDKELILKRDQLGLDQARLDLETKRIAHEHAKELARESLMNKMMEHFLIRGG